MNKRAIWIIDEGFLVPALVSVRSFLAVVQMPVTIMYCGKSGQTKARNAFAEIDQTIDWVEWQQEPNHHRPEFAASIQNRLARMDAMTRYVDELLLLIDADIVFAPGMEQLVQDIESHPPVGPALWGVPDQSVAWQNQFYFHQIDQNGRKQRLHPGEQMELYEDIFGAEWRFLLGSHGFNNGLLAVFQCGEVAEKWKEFYLKGLSHPKVNPDDDQRSLAAALVATRTSTHILPDRYNSRGEMMGEYVAFHALSGRWRMPFRAFEMGEKPCTDFGRVAVEFWGMVPQNLRNDFMQSEQGQIPWRFHALSGPNHFWPMYRSAVRRFAQGHFVEVGCRNGKSTCFMAESIALSGKSLRFDSVACSDRNPDGFATARRNLEALNCTNLVELNEMSSEGAAELYRDGTLDFVSLYGVTSSEELQLDLETWFPKVRAGGVLAGYDFSRDKGLKLGKKGALAAFCFEKGLTCKRNGGQFIIEKEQSDTEIEWALETAVASSTRVQLVPQAGGRLDENS